MRWSVVRLIAFKEARDLLRDRRTVFLILILPVVLYPLFGGAATLIAKTLTGQTTTIGVAGGEHLPPAGGGLPTLLNAAGDGFAEPEDERKAVGTIAIKPITGDPQLAVDTRQADVVLVVPPGLVTAIADRQTPTLAVVVREGDEKSKLAAARLVAAVERWRAKLKEDRFAKANLPADFDKVFAVADPAAGKTSEKRAADELRDVFARVFPFILMMWLLAGAIQPAVDLTAGEKERGTMETLLVSPAGRAEVVVGKWAAVTAFGFASVVWNVLWLTAGALVAGHLLGYPIVKPVGVVACVLTAAPLAGLFAAVCLALGVFARSTKEGQYYLVPLILVAMPLAFYSLVPGNEIGPGNFWLPVAGAMLLQQKFLAVGPDPTPWGYVPLVLVSLLGWVAVALGLAVWQFTREAVLFRELGPVRRRRLFRRKG